MLPRGRKHHGSHIIGKSVKALQNSEVLPYMALTTILDSTPLLEHIEGFDNDSN